MGEVSAHAPPARDRVVKTSYRLGRGQSRGAEGKTVTLGSRSARRSSWLAPWPRQAKTDESPSVII